MKLFAFHDGSACGYYRLLLPLEQMQQAGHTVQTAFGEADPDGDEDIVIGERFDKPGVLPSWRRWAAQSRLVYEIDDDVYNVDPANWLAHRIYKHPVPKDVATHAAQVADLVTVSTEPLAQVMRRETGAQRVVVLPNYIDGKLLNLDRPHRDKLVVGWTGGDSHLRDLAMAGPQLRRFFQRTPGVELHLIGTDFRRTLRMPQARWTNWQDDIWGYYRLIDFDIGLAPIAPTVFAESKSHIKALEYASLGIPVIASDVTPYRDFVLDGVTGFLVRREHEWGRRLWALAKDEAMRVEMGAKARAHAAAFTIQRNWQQWRDAYQTIL